MVVNKKEISGTIAYMLGVKKSIIERDFELDCPGLLENLIENKEITIIRYLSKLRTSIFLNFKNIDYELRYNMRNISMLDEYIDTKNILTLEKWGVPIIKVNFTCEKYIETVTEFINENIDKCASTFDDWVRFDYIRELFIIPKYRKKGVLKKEANKFCRNKNYYPFQMYMVWNPLDKGNILYNDEKFLTFLYSLHKDRFIDRSKTIDASEETKGNIYDFIEDSERVAIAVDCENSDVFKLYGMLRNLNQDSLSKVEKIVLYDDVHTSTAWEWLSKFTKIPVEYIGVARVTEMKSLVDIKMTAGVCKDYYKEGIDSFILFSSDSDFWGLISSIPSARFLVMYEKKLCGASLKKALEKYEITSCCIDDFYTGNANDLKKAVLLDKLEELLPEVIGSDGKELADRIYFETRITTTKNEKENFYNKYIKTLQLKINDEGKFYLHICK